VASSAPSHAIIHSHSRNDNLSRAELEAKTSELKAEVDILRKRNERLQGKVESLVMPAQAVTLFKDMLRKAMKSIQHLTDLDKERIECQIAAIAIPIEDGKDGKVKWQNNGTLQFAIDLLNTSKQAFELVRNSGLIPLPHVRTVQRNMPTGNGMKESGFNSLRFEAIQDATKHYPHDGPERECALAHDEISMHGDLGVRRMGETGSGELVGIVVHYGDRVEGGKELTVADHALIFMARSLGANNDVFLVAFFGVRNLSPEQLETYFWQVVGAMHHIRLYVILSDCDGASVNRSFQQHLTQPEAFEAGIAGFTFKSAVVKNPFRSSRSARCLGDPGYVPIFLMSDVTHGLKKSCSGLHSSRTDPGDPARTRLILLGELKSHWGSVLELYNLEKDANNQVFRLRTEWVFRDVYSRMSEPASRGIIGHEFLGAVRQLIKEDQGHLASDLDGLAEYISTMLDVFDVTRSGAMYRSITDQRLRRMRAAMDKLRNWKKHADAQTAVDKVPHWVSDQLWYDMQLTEAGLTGLIQYMVDTYPQFMGSQRGGVNPIKLTQDIVEWLFGRLRAKVNGGSVRYADILAFIDDEVIKLQTSPDETAAIAERAKKLARHG